MMKDLKRFLRYYRPYKKLFFLDFFCAAASAVLELAFPLAVSRIVDTLLPEGNWKLIVTAAVFLVALYLINAGLKYVISYWGEKLVLGRKAGAVY